MEQLIPWLHGHYNLSMPIVVTPIRSYTNDVFGVDAGGEQFVLKLYGSGWRTEEEVAYEVDLLHHLAARGVGVAQAVEGLDGTVIRTDALPDRSRCTVLFHRAPGTKPIPPFLPELDRRVGQAAAAMHQALDDFVSPHARVPMNIAFLLESPAALVASLIADRIERDRFFLFIERIAETVRAYDRQGLEWGPIHGDLTLDNLHVTSDGEIIFYDFDSGGPGWRAADLPGWAAIHAHMPEASSRARAFLEGYQSVRPLDEVNIQAAPAFFVAYEIWGLEIDLRNRILGKGEEAVHAYLSTALADLYAHAMLI